MLDLSFIGAIFAVLLAIANSARLHAFRAIQALEFSASAVERWACTRLEVHFVLAIAAVVLA